MLEIANNKLKNPNKNPKALYNQQLKRYYHQH